MPPDEAIGPDVEPASPEPASPEPASPEPASPEPASPEPASPEPASAERPRFDLQGHSTQSDGELSPAETVGAARRAGIELFALTDHDSVAGVAEAAAAAAEVGLRLVTGVEISVLDPVAADLHLCGYAFDPADPALLAQLARSREDRERRATHMIAALQENGWSVNHELLNARARAGLTIGRPHLAESVTSDPRNAERLEREGLRNPTEFLVAYLVEGKPAFRERVAPSVAEAIALLHGAGGVAVWAHPYWDVEADAEVIATLERFVGVGLDGVEAFYVTHTRAQTELLLRRASELSLITTGSSDFHGPSHQRFNSFGAFSTFGHQPNLGRLTEV
ncbi:MAG: PHP domain-containing protein [Acidobacteriota bacterium]|nr:PHP domain-containing protein [Acidobacteriota bacterium]